MEAIEVDGELVEIVGPRAMKVRSRSQLELWYAIDLDDRGGTGSCTCKGFQVRKACRHLEIAQRFARGSAVPEAVDTELVRVALTTARYQTKEYGGRLPVGITVRLPRWKLVYELADNVKEAAPVGLRNIADDEAFERAYLARLDSFGVGYFRRRFSEIATRHDNPNLCLLCYEDLSIPGEVCHRRMFAGWWESHTGQEVLELGAAVPATLL